MVSTYLHRPIRTPEDVLTKRIAARQLSHEQDDYAQIRDCLDLAVKIMCRLYNAAPQASDINGHIEDAMAIAEGDELLGHISKAERLQEKIDAAAYHEEERTRPDRLCPGM